MSVLTLTHTHIQSYSLCITLYLCRFDLNITFPSRTDTEALHLTHPQSLFNPLVFVEFVFAVSVRVVNGSRYMKVLYEGLN